VRTEPTPQSADILPFNVSRRRFELCPEALETAAFVVACSPRFGHRDCCGALMNF